jgi:hypothetical protein
VAVIAVGAGGVPGVVLTFVLGSDMTRLPAPFSKEHADALQSLSESL